MSEEAMTRQCCLLLLLCCLSIDPIEAQVGEAALQILEAHVEQLGGRRNLENVRSALTTGTMSMAESDVRFEISLAQQNGAYFFEMKLGETVIKQGYDGKVAWEFSDSGYRILQGSERVAAINNNSRPFPALSWIDGTYDGKISLIGREMMEKKNCYVIDFSPRGGQKIRRYFDPDTYLVRRYKSHQEARPEPVKIQVKDSEFRSIDGLKFPGKQQFAADGKLFYTIEFESITINPRLDSSMFELPIAVKRLMDSPAKKAPHR